jgi:hypothetical protein
MLGDEIENEELENEELEEVEPFLIDEKEDVINCFTCSKYRVGGKICGTFKFTNEHYMKNGRDNIENWFYCANFNSK